MLPIGIYIVNPGLLNLKTPADSEEVPHWKTFVLYQQERMFYFVWTSCIMIYSKMELYRVNTLLGFHHSVGKTYIWLGTKARLLNVILGKFNAWKSLHFPYVVTSPADKTKTNHNIVPYATLSFWTRSSYKRATSELWCI